MAMDQFTYYSSDLPFTAALWRESHLCRMFNRAIHTQTLPKYLSSGHDPLYRYYQW